VNATPTGRDSETAFAQPIDTDATRRGNRGEDELALRETRQAHHPMLFRYLKGSV
jgi:hypothetical protein